MSCKLIKWESTHTRTQCGGPQLTSHIFPRVAGRFVQTTSIFPEILITRKSWKVPNQTSIWSGKIIRKRNNANHQRQKGKWWKTDPGACLATWENQMKQPEEKSGSKTSCKQCMVPGFKQKFWKIQENRKQRMWTGLEWKFLNATNQKTIKFVCPLWFCGDLYSSEGFITFIKGQLVTHIIRLESLPASFTARFRLGCSIKFTTIPAHAAAPGLPPLILAQNSSNYICSMQHCKPYKVFKSKGRLVTTIYKRWLPSARRLKW